MNITVVGTGYVGLVTGACLAEVGHQVTCLDIEEHKIEDLKKGKVPFYEPGLETIIKKGLSNGMLKFTSSYSEATRGIGIYFVCVGTPPKDDGSSNLNFLSESLLNLSSSIENDSIIFIKSTVPVGTNKLMRTLIDDNKKDDIDIELASNPEFLKEGDAVRDFMRPDRIIVGTNDENVSNTVRELYKPLNKQKDKVLVMRPESAELTKYAANSFLATKISFMNELARLCDSLDIEIEDIRNGIGSDPRIGTHFLYSGLGYGGSCFPKDIDSLLKTFEVNKIENKILSSVKNINTSQIDYFLSKIFNFYSNKDIKEKSFIIWGLSFKPETDDVRESVSIKLIKALSKKCKKLFLYDPVATESAKGELKEVKNIIFIDNPYSCIEDSDALVICTEWKLFWNPDFKKLQNLKDKTIFDGRNILNKDKLEQYGLKYFGIGS
tara:strand:+ start:3201 stop:4511 length:1311 start_codon:yes stop_codon:yes gene_type:complete